jgi:hypothetical protein
MTKLAFQAAIPGPLFDDPTDCLHRVVKPMLTAIRDQMREKGIPANVRISIMVDEVPVKPLEFPTTVINEVRKTMAMNSTEFRQAILDANSQVVDA